MEWTIGELRTIEIKEKVTRRKRGKYVTEHIWKDKKILAPYNRIVAQLLREDEHG
jgi:hypothetical protein